MFTLTIETDNAAFGERKRKDEVCEEERIEVARILRRTAELLETYSSGTLRDSNGNTVGKYGFK